MMVLELFPHLDPFLLYEIFVECEGNKETMTETVMLMEQNSDTFFRY